MLQLRRKESINFRFASVEQGIGAGKRAAAVIFVLLCAVLVLASPVYAFEGRGGDTVTIGADEIVEDDLYIGAQTIVVDGVVRGDLFFGATTVQINGTVEGDVMGGSQSLTINGTVDGDVRVGLAALTIADGGSVGGDLLMGGYSLDAQPGSTIGGDLYLGGAQARLAGLVEQDVVAGLGSLEIAGTVWGNVDVEVGDDGGTPPFNPMSFMPDAPPMPTIPVGFTIHENATIEGEINYRSPTEAAIPASISDRVNFERQVSETVVESSPTDQIWRILQRIIALVLIGMLLVWIFRRQLQGAADVLDSALGTTVLWGIITALLTPIVIVVGIGLLIFVAILFGLAQLGLISGVLISIGIPLLILVGVAFVLIWGLVSKVFVGYWLGRKIMTGSSVWGPALTGIIIIAVLSSIPYASPLVNSVVAILGLGAVWVMLRNTTSRAATS